MNIHMQTLKKSLVPVCCMLLTLFVLAGGAPPGAAKAGNASDKPATTGKQAALDNEGKKTAPVTQKITRQGISIEFSATPAPGRSMTGEEIFAAQLDGIMAERMGKATRGGLVDALYNTMEHQQRVISKLRSTA